MQIMTQIRNVFSKLFGKYLFATNTVCSSVMMAVGDGIDQNLVSNQVHDWQRTRNMAVVGFCLGPLQHFFYKFIDQRYPCRSFRIVLKKVALEQILASPIYIVSFFVCCGTIERQTTYKYVDELRKKFLDIYVIDCLVWPPSQLINFCFLKPKYRMLYVNCTTVVYDIFLSYVKHGDYEA